MPDVSIPILPTSMDTFMQLRDRVAMTADGGAAMFVLALILYADPATQQVGEHALIAMADASLLDLSPSGYKGYTLRRSGKQLLERQIGKAPYLPKSYILGAEPGNRYTPPPMPWTVRVGVNRYSGSPSDGKVKLYVTCAGAATPRPLTMQRNSKGMWKALEWSSLLVGVTGPLGNTYEI